MMLFYAQDRNDVFEPLKQSLNGRASEACLESYSKLEDLFQRLHKPRVNLEIGVFSIGSVAELDLLLTIKDLLSDMRLVLVLADNDPQTLADAMIALGSGRQAPYWDDLEEHLIPTLAIAGALDPKYLGIAKLMKGVCREIELAIVPGCGHNVHFENPAAYTEHLIAFLED